MSSVVMRSKNFSSSSARCPSMVEGCWSACSRVAAWMSVRSSAARPFRYACIMGWSVLEVSKLCDKCFAMCPDMYASRVSSSEIGRRSVSESGLGIGTL